ncbi:Protein CBG09915 [Caenorhabditis briggsae]|uniref:Protein CBG09915 n=1 Tax=Caenorhabditis briggsae TaxID=6238 RepID=A8X9Y5_CAEBR|nr:Protein CBG09915 [Caenorhabditis briggsae]CAP29450.1 Protein CBG09915 [Caenorhabditis briggsae]
MKHNPAPTYMASLARNHTEYRMPTMRNLMTLIPDWKSIIAWNTYSSNWNRANNVSKFMVSRLSACNFWPEVEADRLLDRSWSAFGQKLLTAAVGRTMIGFWPEFEGAACYAARASLIINKIQVNIFNVKCLGDIATRRNQRNSWMLENSKKDKKVNQAEFLLPYSSRFTATSSKFKNINHDFLIFLYFFP